MATGAERASQPRVLVADDHSVLASALELVLEREGMSVEVVKELTPSNVVSTARRFRPDVALLDLYLGSDLATPMVAPLVELGAKVLILTSSDHPAHLADCLEAGAAAVLPKADSLNELLDAVRAAFAGDPVRPAFRESLLRAGRRAKEAEAARAAPFQRLTRRERETLSALIDGQTADQIAAASFLSLTTVRSHIRSILAKLGVKSQLAAVAMARRAGWKG